MLFWGASVEKWRSLIPHRPHQMQTHLIFYYVYTYKTSLCCWGDSAQASFLKVLGVLKSRSFGKEYFEEKTGEVLIIPSRRVWLIRREALCVRGCARSWESQERRESRWRAEQLQKTEFKTKTLSNCVNAAGVFTGLHDKTFATQKINKIHSLLFF